MSAFERPERKRELPEVPERLIRLDRELKTERTKDYDYLYAVRDNRYGERYRIKVAVMRIPSAQPGDYEFVATASVGGKVHRQHHFTPSGAFAKIVNSLPWTVSKLSYERNMSKNEFCS